MGYDHQMRKFREIRDKLSELMEENDEVFTKARDYAAEFNSRLKSLKQRLRDCVDEKGEGSQQIAEFKVTPKKPKKTYDVDVLQNGISLSELQKCGAVKMRIEYDVSEDRLLDLVSQGKLSDEVMKAACTEKKLTTQVTGPYAEYQF
jgi:hypothetical protein